MANSNITVPAPIESEDYVLEAPSGEQIVTDENGQPLTVNGPEITNTTIVNEPLPVSPPVDWGLPAWAWVLLFLILLWVIVTLKQKSIKR